MATKKDPSADTAWMKEAFIGVQLELALKLKRAAQSIEHCGTHGGVNEDHWIDVFRAYLPNRYAVATGFVIDSLGNRSDQIDIVIFDRHFTPTLLDQQKHRYIPAEAVYGVFESKPQFDKSYLEYAGQKAASVRPKDELGWVQPALKKHSSRITARDLATGIVSDEAGATKSQSLTLDVEGFLKS